MSHEAEIEGIGVGADGEGGNVPAVILSARDELLPIFVTADQAQSIQLALEGEPFERPLTHDLMLNFVTELGGAVDRVRIDDLADGTFYAKIDIQRYENGRPEKFVFDARPSDAVSLGVRADCPIIVSDEILNQAGRPPEELEEESQAGGSGMTSEPTELGEEAGEFEEEIGGPEERVKDELDEEIREELREFEERLEEFTDEGEEGPDEGETESGDSGASESSESSESDESDKSGDDRKQ